MQDSLFIGFSTRVTIMLKNLKTLLNRILPSRFRSLFAVILALVTVVTSGFWWVPAIAQKINGVPGSPSATMSISGEQLPAPAPQFGGVIKDDALQSKPWWAPRIVPPKDAPNVLKWYDVWGIAVLTLVRTFSNRETTCVVRIFLLTPVS